jgi:hypothetical protein
MLRGLGDRGTTAAAYFQRPWSSQIHDPPKEMERAGTSGWNERNLKDQLTSLTTQHGPQLHCGSFQACQENERANQKRL